MIRYRAAWIVPIEGPPLADGWVLVDGEQIVAVGRGVARDGVPERDLGARAIMPGVVNAHTHLELSYLHERIPPAEEFTDWIRAVVAARRTEPDPSSPAILQAIDAAIAHAHACGTTAVGDISNTLVTVGPLQRSAIGGVVFSELIRFRAPDPAAFVGDAIAQLAAIEIGGPVRVSLAAHAPYSVAPQVFAEIRRAVDRVGEVYSVHLSESRAESEFVATGQGPWRAFLEEVGAWNPEWTPAGTSPVEYLDAAGFLGPRALVVHGVQMSREDLDIVRRHGATLVSCPRSNVLTGAGVPPVKRFFESGVRIAIGTDSLASTPDLNVFAEMAEMRRLAPEVPARVILTSATRHGAHALGMADTLGTIEPGKSSRLLSVALAGRVADVEEYLVAGIMPDQLQWLETA